MFRGSDITRREQLTTIFGVLLLTNLFGECFPTNTQVARSETTFVQKMDFICVRPRKNVRPIFLYLNFRRKLAKVVQLGTSTVIKATFFLSDSIQSKIHQDSRLKNDDR